MMKFAPGPKNFWQIIKTVYKRQTDPMKFYHDTFSQYGDIAYIRIGKQGFLMLNDAEAIEQVLQTDAKIYTKSTAYERFKLIFGKGLLVSEGDLWKRQRRLMAGAFTTRSIEKIHPLIVEETKSMMAKWEESSEIDLAEEMNHITLQIITKSMLGQLEESETKVVRSAVQEMLKYLQTNRHLWLQLILNILPIKDKLAMAIKIETSLPLKSTKRFFKSIEAVDELVHRMIEKRRKQNLQENLIDMLIKMTDDDQSVMTNQQLRDEVVNILIAGHETTSNALSWTFHQLLKYPEVLKKVEEEITQFVKGETPTYAELAQLPYTQAMFLESMRLYPPFWRISRRATEKTIIKGYDVPAGTNVIASIFTVQRSGKYWKDPTEFRPERFMEGAEEHHRFAFIPFGGGPRICIGANMAMTEAITILASCLKNFSLSKNFNKDPSFLLSLTMQPKEGCKVIVKRKKL
jgi:cytochrome P450